MSRARADRDALLHAARQLVRVAPLEALEPGQRHQLTRVCLVLAGIQPAHLGREQDVVECAAPGQEDRRLEDHRGVRDRAQDLKAPDADRAGGRLGQAGDDPERRRLAAAAGAEEGDELLFIDVERDVVEGKCFAEALGEDPDLYT